MPLITFKQKNELKRIRCQITALLLELEDLTNLELKFSDVLEYGCKYLGVDIKEVLTESRRSDLVECRNFVSFFCRTELKITTVEIGFELGREHSNIVTACKKFAEHLEYDEELRDKYNEFKYDLI